MEFLSPVWDRTFSKRRENFYASEDTRLSPTSNDAYIDTDLIGADPITAYFKIGSTEGLDPPHYQYHKLESFLRSADASKLDSRPADTDRRVIIDDRRDDTVASNPTRDWCSDFWQYTPPKGVDIWYRLANAHELHERLKRKVRVTAIYKYELKYLSEWSEHKMAG